MSEQQLTLSAVVYHRVLGAPLSARRVHAYVLAKIEAGEPLPTVDTIIDAIGVCRTRITFAMTGFERGGIWTRQRNGNYWRVVLPDGRTTPWPVKTVVATAVMPVPVGPIYAARRVDPRNIAMPRHFTPDQALAFVRSKGRTVQHVGSGQYVVDGAAGAVSKHELPIIAAAISNQLQMGPRDV